MGRTAKVMVSAQVISLMSDPKSLAIRFRDEDDQEEIEGVEHPAQIAGNDGVTLARGSMRFFPSRAIR